MTLSRPEFRNLRQPFGALRHLWRHQHAVGDAVEAIGVAAERERSDKINGYYTPDHQFEKAYCPCLAPAVTKIQVDVANLVSCDTACGELDLACQPETAWTLGQESGGEAVYVTSDGTRYHPVSCGGVPSTEISRGGRIYTLSELHCGCQ